jgi:hypothetical protein
MPVLLARIALNGLSESMSPVRASLRVVPLVVADAVAAGTAITAGARATTAAARTAGSFIPDSFLLPGRLLRRVMLRSGGVGVIAFP